MPQGGGSRQPALDFLRGIAILGVVAFHAVAIFDPNNDLIKRPLELGFQGVQLFFLVSAWTMCYMWDRRLGEQQATLKFYIRRIFRIAPPFWLALFGYLALNGLGSTEWAPDGIHAKQIVTNFLFVSGFWPDTINAIVPGGWSIIDEMMFYALFPLLICSFGKRPWPYVGLSFAIYLINLIAIAPLYEFFYRNYPQADLLGAFVFFQFFNQAPIFLLGIFVYNFDPSQNRMPLCVILTGATWLGIALTLKALHVLSPEPFFWVGNFFLMGFVAIAFRFRLRSRIIETFGRLSYSIYLVHFAIILAVEWCFIQLGYRTYGGDAFAIGVGSSIGLSWCLGYVIEKTVAQGSTRAGQQLIKTLSDVKLRSRNPNRRSDLPP